MRRGRGRASQPVSATWQRATTSPPRRPDETTIATASLASSDVAPLIQQTPHSTDIRIAGCRIGTGMPRTFRQVHSATYRARQALLPRRAFWQQHERGRLSRIPRKTRCTLTPVSNRQLNPALDAWRKRLDGYTRQLVDSMNLFAAAGQCDWPDTAWPSNMPAPMTPAVARDCEACARRARLHSFGKSWSSAFGNDLPSPWRPTWSNPSPRLFASPFSHGVLAPRYDA